MLRTSGHLKGHKAPILDFAWGHGTLFSGSRDGGVRLWDVNSGQAIKAQGGHAGHVTVIEAYSPDPSSINADSAVFVSGIFSCMHALFF
jgi:WD40 repeat protein